MGMSDGHTMQRLPLGRQIDLHSLPDWGRLISSARDSASNYNRIVGN